MPAATATLLLKDNRTAVCGTDEAGVRTVVLPTLPNGLAFTAKKGDGTDATGTETAATATAAAFVDSPDAARVVVPIDATQANGVNKYIRKQFFKDAWGGPHDGKWCWTDIKGMPLDASGVPTTVEDAVDAETTALTTLGGAVTNYAQPGPLPGTYEVTERQQGYSPYIGWTCQHDRR